MYVLTVRNADVILYVSNHGSLKRVKLSPFWAKRRRTSSRQVPSRWSPNSPDLNPVTEAGLQSPVKDIDDLQNRVMQEWDQLDQRVIDQATRQWLHGRVRACVAQAGGHFE